MNIIKLGTWYAIPGYRAYRIIFTDDPINIRSVKNKYHYSTVISFKNYKKYPLGYYIKADKSGRYELTNSYNERDKLNAQYIADLIQNYKYDLKTDLGTYKEGRQRVVINRKNPGFSFGEISNN